MRASTALSFKRSKKALKKKGRHLSIMPALITPYHCQEEALKAFHKSLKAGKHKMALVMATATGKTNVAIWAIEEYLKTYGLGKVLFIAHLDQIWQQADERFKQLTPALSRGFIGSKQENINAGVVAASITTLSNHIKNGTLPFTRTHFDFIVVDEFHHAAAKTYSSVLEYFKPKVLLGMSCIKERYDQKDFLQYFGNNIIYEIDTVAAIEEKAIAGLKYYAVKDDVDYKVHRNGYEYTEMDQNKKLIIPEKDKRVIEKWKESCGDKKTIVFCANIAHARRTAEYFAAAGVSVVAIHHYHPDHTDSTPKINLQKTEDFRNGVYQVACTIDKWLEGADFPDVEVGLFLRPTKSWRVFVQSRGRVLRKFNGKKNGIIIDAVGNHRWIKIYRNLLAENMLVMSHRLGNKVDMGDIGEWIEKGNSLFIKKYQEISKEYKEEIAKNPGRALGGFNKPEAVYEPGVFELNIEEVEDIFFRTGEIDITREHLIEDYLALEKELGRQPTLNEYEIKCHSLSALDRVFGKPGWRNMLKELGRTPKV